MKALERRLKRDAQRSAEWRGHHLTIEWLKIGEDSWSKTCRRLGCDAEVIVNTRPAPNEIDISGKAVALHCKGGGLL